MMMLGGMLGELFSLHSRLMGLGLVNLVWKGPSFGREDFRDLIEVNSSISRMNLTIESQTRRNP
jgi:hypothetical protein